MKLSRRAALTSSIRIATALVFTGVSRSAFASELDDTLAEVKAARANMKTLKGPFTQERTIGMLSAKVKSTGTLTMVRPDRLRWELAPPDDIVYWVGPEGFSYKSARGQGHIPAAAARLASAMEDVRLVLGGDLDKLRTRYILFPSGEGRAEDIGESWRMASVLGKQGVPNRVDSWGKETPHDWMTWRKMLPQYLEEWTK